VSCLGVSHQVEADTCLAVKTYTGLRCPAQRFPCVAGCESGSTSLDLFKRKIPEDCAALKGKEQQRTAKDLVAACFTYNGALSWLSSVMLTVTLIDIPL
jgi:hypothetical protein